jgi:hypothetical protein
MTQQIFSQIQYEITPRGVMERIMRMMSQLHVEFLDLWEEKEKGKSFVNADLLIPLLVLVLIQCRKIDPTSCDILPLRVALVDQFQSTCYYSVTGEEAYYLTCLRAAIEFIMKSYCSPFSSDKTECSECLEKMHRIQLTRKTSIDKTDIDKKQHILLPQSNTEVKQAIQALSEWISKQNIRREENNISVQDINTWMMS